MAVLDFMSPPSDPIAFAREAKRKGYEGVMRYFGNPADPKILKPSEIAAYHGEGLGVGMVYEENQYRPTEGADAGRADGGTARAEARALGIPDDWPIYGAVDFDPYDGGNKRLAIWGDALMPTIADYLRNFRGCYGNARTCAYMAAHGVCTHFWMHDWGGGDFAGKHLHQHGGQVTVAGTRCDVSVVYQTCCLWFPGQGMPSESAPPVLRLGSSGPNVTNLQAVLLTWGLYGGSISGMYDNATEAAVRSFQTAKGLVSDGIVGPATLTAIAAALSAPHGSMLSLGSAGPDVYNLQVVLTAWKYYGGPLNSSFDAATQTAVDAFQAASGLLVDGIVGPMTLAAITRRLTGASG